METQSSGLNDYRTIFLISFIILMVGIIPYGLIDSTFSWAAFVTAGALFMVALGMMLTTNQDKLFASRSQISSKNSRKHNLKAVSKSSKLVRKNTPKSKSSKRR